MASNKFKSASMKNLRNPAASFVVPLDFETLGKHYSSLFEESTNKMNDRDKMKTARQSLHRYIFIICHTIQHFGHHLTANEQILIHNACEKTLQWMWRRDIKSLEDFRQRILQLLRTCTPIMKQLLFRAEQQNSIQ